MKPLNTGKLKIGEHYIPPPQRIVFTQDELIIQSVLLNEPRNQIKRVRFGIVIVIITFFLLKAFL